ncbi:MAG: undecaprenyldiphospho-muramoylpentapeptide beta-N-acetylglucosaminyltransferase [Burkholderia sp.]|nr:undecaprenyldiphospho-muramoylpentapeptide beta-N-acetylglucosaminyltransferase [Burkholderia sp.]
MTAPRTLMIIAGSTGGHIFAGLAIARRMKEHGWNIIWLGNPHGMEATLVPKHDILMEYVHFVGFRGKGLKTNLILPLSILRACWQSRLALQRSKPNVVLGMGGYITFPAGLIAAILGYPLILHEQNSTAGLTNKLLSKFANRMLVAFKNTLPNAEWTGNPVREEFLRIAAPELRYATRSGPLSLLIIGGSLGATALNNVIPKALTHLTQSEQPLIIHQSGIKYIDELKANYASAGFVSSKNIRLVPFIDDMASAYAEADLIICRSGAMTVSEIATVGIAAFFVPFPYAVDDHQTTNATLLVRTGGAVLVQQRDLSAKLLANWIRSQSRLSLMEMAIRSRSLMKADSTEKILKAIVDVGSKNINKKDILY